MECDGRRKILAVVSVDLKRHVYFPHCANQFLPINSNKLFKRHRKNRGKIILISNLLLIYTASQVSRFPQLNILATILMVFIFPSTVQKLNFQSMSKCRVSSKSKTSIGRSSIGVVIQCSIAHCTFFNIEFVFPNIWILTFSRFTTEIG